MLAGAWPGRRGAVAVGGWLTWAVFEPGNPERRLLKRNPGAVKRRQSRGACAAESAASGPGAAQRGRRLIPPLGHTTEANRDFQRAGNGLCLISKKCSTH